MFSSWMKRGFAVISSIPISLHDSSSLCCPYPLTNVSDPFGFNLVSGSVSGFGIRIWIQAGQWIRIRIRIQEGRIDP
jgi:hypothetical protein